ncbi:MAG TPA: class E sortase [Pseudonocardiaceae bacterium]|nr:class E sortase [Pseudonocardiaceae bacterium]
MDESARRAESPRPPVASRAQRVEVGFGLAGHVLGIVAVLALSFLAEVVVLGNIQHDRDQIRLAGEFRGELAKGTAPVGPRDDNLTLLAPGSPVAIVEIPKLKLREAVVEGTSSGTLMSGPGHRRDTPLPGQAGTSVIAGRRTTYGGPFGAIDQLRAGDVIMVTTGQGKSSFRVSGLRHSGDPLPPALTAGQGRLTLVTSAGPVFAPSDLLRVDAALTSAAQPRPVQLPAGSLSAAEEPMAGDSSALLGVFEWSLLALAAAVATAWIRGNAGPGLAWLIGLPVLGPVCLRTFDVIATLFPNLL